MPLNDSAKQAPLNAAVSIFVWFLFVFYTILVEIATLLIFVPYTLFFERDIKQVNHYAAVAWAKMILASVPFWKTIVIGQEKIQPRQTYVVVSNHQSIIDIFVVLACLPLHFKFIAKKELFRVPFLGWHLFFAGYIPLDRGNASSAKEAMNRAGEWIKKKVSVLFFPEGTRSETGQMKPFKPGAFKLAQQEGVPVLPVVLYGTGQAIPKKSWILRDHSRFYISIEKPVFIGPHESLDEATRNIYGHMKQRLDELVIHHEQGL